MFILDTDSIPASTPQLTDAILNSLGKWLQIPASVSPLAISGNLPDLQSIHIDVTNCRVNHAPPLPEQTALAEPGPTAVKFVIRAQPILLQEIPVNLDLSADHAAFGYARGVSGELIATLLDASHGRVSVQIAQQPLETAIRNLAAKAAGAHGVAVQKVNVSLNSISPRELQIELKIEAKKFMTAIITISGRLSVDDEMVATATQLRADAQGMVGTIAVNILRPQLHKLEGKRLSLMAFSLGRVKLHDVQADTSDGLRLTAAFGSEGA